MATIKVSSYRCQEDADEDIKRITAAWLLGCYYEILPPNLATHVIEQYPEYDPLTERNVMSFSARNHIKTHVSESGLEARFFFQNQLYASLVFIVDETPHPIMNN